MIHKEIAILKYISRNQLIYLKQKYNKKVKYQKLIKIINKHNKEYILKESKNKIFSNINGISLDKNQKEAILTDEVNTLVIAGAGSGKSLTIIGKIIYLITKQNINSKEILCISLTNDATTNLKLNLNKNNKYDVEIMTFHKLAMNIIRTYDKKIKIANQNKLSNIIDNYFNEIINNKYMMFDILKYVYLYNVKTNNKRTLNNDLVYNENDYLIANYMYLNGIKYNYSYKKEKSIFRVQNTQIIINHGINEIIKNNNDIEYYDIDFISSDVFKRLNKQLLKNNIKSKEINYIEIYNNIDKEYIKQFKQLIETFINTFKSNNYEFNYLHKINKKVSKDKNKLKRKRNKFFLYIIKNIYAVYEYHLKINNEIDFNDMINLATQIIEKNDIKLNYKYIIIDEYQDTSISKYNLIKSIKKICNSKLMVVGDDFQSIYGFTGCSLDVFLNFNKYYGYTKIITINKTYRSSQELIDIAGRFVMKNNRQIKKKLLSTKHLNNPIKCIYYTNDFINKLEQVIQQIPDETKIMILGRNNKDIFKLSSNKFKLEDSNIIYLPNKNKQIYFKTVHKSKGLEEENTIIINLEDKITGFPNKITDDEILKYVKKQKEFYPYEEERRLFYVALTRSKNHVYLMINNNSKSIFVTEIEKYINKKNFITKL